MSSYEGLFSAFSSDNARNETNEDIISCFIQTDVFWSLFSKSHTILYGSRGAGKTLISRMASFPLLSQSPNPLAREIISKRDYVGVFVNTDIRFVGSARSAMWGSGDFSDLHFIWKFNLNCLKSLCVTIDSIIGHEVCEPHDRYNIEIKIASRIAHMLKLSDLPRLQELPQIIANYESTQREQMASAFLNGEPIHPFLAGPFSVEIFEPIQLLIEHFASLFNEYEETKWLFFIDEAEFLTEAQLRILNSFMRTHTGKVFLKIATLPYHYRTFETNISITLQEGDDYRVEILDASPTYTLNSENARPIYDFARALYDRRVRHLQSHRTIPSPTAASSVISSLDAVLGVSRLLAKKPRSQEPALALNSVVDFIDELTYNRAEKLLNDPARFDDQIWRKIIGPVMLKKEYISTRGGQKAMDVYSGVELLVRCTDGVPRRMINIFHLIAKEAVRSVGRKRASSGHLGGKMHRTLLPYRAQNRILDSFGTRRHANSLSVPIRGPDLYNLISTLGLYFEDRLHASSISTDVVVSFTVDEDCPDTLWDVVRLGIAYGHIFPNWATSRPDSLTKAGTYRLSFCYAPHFHLYPIRGRAHSLKKISNQSSFKYSSPTKSVTDEQMELFAENKNA